jgi:low affinity Fe/Cu permease
MVSSRTQVQASAEPAPPVAVRDRFNRLAARLTDALGSFEALVASVLLVVVWALTGPIFDFSDTWQLFINTTTTVITFWMVFVIQSSANRDAKAIHLKLDELLRVHEAARNELITLEAQPEAVVTRTAEGLAAIAREATGRGVAEGTVTQPSAGRPKQATVTAMAPATPSGTKTASAKRTTRPGTSRQRAAGRNGSR